MGKLGLIPISIVARIMIHDPPFVAKVREDIARRAQMRVLSAKLEVTEHHDEVERLGGIHDSLDWLTERFTKDYGDYAWDIYGQLFHFGDYTPSDFGLWEGNALPATMYRA